jgi:hypothetical protein
VPAPGTAASINRASRSGDDCWMVHQVAGAVAGLALGVAERVLALLVCDLSAWH